MEIKIAPFVNAKREMALRNSRAEEYSRMCMERELKRKQEKKERITEFISAVFMCIGVPMFFLLCLFM